MKKKLILLTLSLALVLALAPIASAAGEGMYGGQSNNNSTPGTNWIPLVEKLDLSDQQSKQLKELNLSTYQDSKPLKAKLQDAKFQLRQLGLEKNADKSAVDAKIKEINDFRAQLHKIRQQRQEKANAILTPEQQAKLKAMKEFGEHGGRCPKGCK